jgi:uncharacterized alkaline shock family protein YloU
MEAGHAVSSRLGRITISSEAIAQIVAETALECYGVVGMKGSLRGQLARARGRPRGIEIGRDGGEVTVDLHVVVEYGLNLAEVASSVSNRVAYEVQRLTGLKVRAVEVHVDDVRTGGKGPPRRTSSASARSSARLSPRSRRAAAASTTSTSIRSPTATPAPTSR